MTFNDIFKSSFLENVTSVSLFDMALALVLEGLPWVLAPSRTRESLRLLLDLLRRVTQ